jgi:hypothetical protein
MCARIDFVSRTPALSCGDPGRYRWRSGRGFGAPAGCGWRLGCIADVTTRWPEVRWTRETSAMRINRTAFVISFCAVSNVRAPANPMSGRERHALPRHSCARRVVWAKHRRLGNTCSGMYGARQLIIGPYYISACAVSIN